MTVSLSAELLGALDALAASRNESRSALVELLLREHPLVQAQVQRSRQRRSPEKLQAIAAQARANLERALASGQVALDA